MNIVTKNISDLTLNKNTAEAIYIYGLKCPISGKVRYVGKTKKLRHRIQHHLGFYKCDVNNHKKRWLKKLLSQGKEPEMVILEEIYDGQWEEAEIKWIKKGRDEKWGLTNIASGGANNLSPSFDYSDIEFLLTDVLSDYVTEEKNEKLNKLPFEVIKTIAHKAAVNGLNTWFGIGCDRDIEKSMRIRRETINSELDLILI